MALLNVTDFAKFAGVSRVSVQKAIRSGRLAQRKDKLLNTKTKLNEDYIAKHNGGQVKHPNQKDFPGRVAKLKRTIDAKKKAKRKSAKKKGSSKSTRGGKPAAPVKKKATERTAPAAKNRRYLLSGII